jgi:hypothetical protein
MRIENGEQLHAILRAKAEKIRGVFYGHVHGGVQRWVDGILYCSVGSLAMHFPILPGCTAAVVEPDPISFVNYVTVGSLGTLVKQQWIMQT